MKKSIAIIFITIGFLFMVAGCATTQVNRVETQEVIDLSGKWNDTDSRLVAEEMIKDALARPWHGQFMRSHSGQLPIVIVGTIRNLSHEHINTRTFVKDLEKALINSGNVGFVADRGQKNELRDEIKDQASHASESTAKSIGEETGADFMLKGEINTIRDKVEGKEVMFYQVDLELISIENHRKVWIGDKKIKKFIKQSRLGI